MSTYVRKTRDEYEVQSNYGHGWECLCASESRKDARDDLRAYRQNEPATPTRMIKRRVRIEAAGSA